MLFDQFEVERTTKKVEDGGLESFDRIFLRQISVSIVINAINKNKNKIKYYPLFLLPNGPDIL